MMPLVNGPRVGQRENIGGGGAAKKEMNVYWHDRGLKLCIGIAIASIGNMGKIVSAGGRDEKGESIVTVSRAFICPPSFSGYAFEL